jgi:MFS family permease
LISGLPRSLWHNPEFLKLWAGQTISSVGSGVTASALPLTAVLMLGASAGDMGWLLAVESAPVLVVGMFAGVWVDRLPRRRLLIGADLGRAGLLACIPLLAYLGGLRIEHLYVVALTTGVLTVWGTATIPAFLTHLGVGALRVRSVGWRVAQPPAGQQSDSQGWLARLIHRSR